MIPNAVPTWLPQSSRAPRAIVPTTRATAIGAATRNGKTMTHATLT